MSPSPPARAARRILRPWLLHAVGLAVVLGVGFELHRIPLGARSPEAWPGWPSGADGPAAVVVDRAAIEAQRRDPPPFSRRDWGLAWLNTLEQEIGPARVLDASRLAQAPLESLSLLVITAGAQDCLDAAQTARLEAWVVTGGALIVEWPGRSLAPLAGVSPLPEAAASAPAALHAGLDAHPGFLPPRPGLERLPLWTRLGDSRPLAADARLLASLGGWPLFVGRHLGAGEVVAVAADVGLLLVATQQGLPAEDGVAFDRHTGRLAPDLKTADLVPDAAWLDNDVPLADLLERALIQHLRRRVPVPAFWYWPDGAPGVYLMTHDDEARGARAEWMMADETARSVPSTVYWIATPSQGRPSRDREAAARAAAGGHAVGLHWVLGGGEGTLRQVWGLPKLGPFLREVTLPEQAARLRGIASDGGPVRHNRLHYLLWQKSWALPFAQMAAAGLDFDSSYGPDFTCKGYLFGTAYPFRPLDVAGLPFALRELPYEHSEMEAGADSLWLDGLAARSREGDHAAIVSLFHPPFMAFAPSADSYRLWRALPGSMAAAGHPALTMQDVRRFVAARTSGALSLAPDGPDAWRLAWDVPRDAPPLLVTVAAELDGRPLAAAGPVAGTGRLLPSLGGERWLAFPAAGHGQLRLERSAVAPR